MRRIGVGAALVLVALAPAACRRGGGGGGPVRVSETRTPMGTYMAITVYAADEAAGRRAIDAAFARVEQVEAALSTYRRDSDISRLNRGAGGPPMAVDGHLVAVLRRAAAASAETDGALDVTVGPLVRLYARCWRRRRLPTEAELAEVRPLVGYRGLEVDPAAGTVRLARAKMRLDVAAIGKGYIVDQAVAALRAVGIAAALVDAGGDIYALGAPPNRQGWLIGVRDPGKPRAILIQRLLLTDTAVATSGDYEQFIVIHGRRYSHILDPRTGRPVESMSSVTVLARDATTADAYATAASVLGPKAAVAFADKRPGVELMVLHRQGDTLARAASGGFARYQAAADTPASSTPGAEGPVEH